MVHCPYKNLSDLQWNNLVNGQDVSKMRTIEREQILVEYKEEGTLALLKTEKPILGRDIT